jgi:hypothetical protein
MEVITMSAIALALTQSVPFELTPFRKVLIGGVGALAPIIVSLVFVDSETIFSRVTVTAVMTYCIRVGVLFAIGGGMAWAHHEEKSILKLFELGIVAPALLTGVLNGTTNVRDTNSRAAMQPAAVTASLSDFFIPTAYAQTTEGDIKKYTPPTESISAQAWRGLSGARNDEVWHVVVGTYNMKELRNAKELALELARKINEQPLKIKAEVYANETYYAVIIGANLCLDEARALKRRATDSRVPTYGEIYLYNPWAAQ